MIDTGIRQLRMALSMIFGKPFDPGNLQRLVQDAILTQDEFGISSEEVQEFLAGPLADPTLRKDVQEQALRRTLRNLLRNSPYYQQFYAALPFAPRDLTLDNLHQIPLTEKSAVVAHQRDFLAHNSRPYLSTRSSGTTGSSLEIWLSCSEVEVWSALGALASLLRSNQDRHSCWQIATALRGTMTLEMAVRQCQLLEGRVHLQGILPVEMGLDALLKEGTETPTVLQTYPSYLAALVVAARRRGLTRHDFRINQIFTGGEVLSRPVAQAAEETFGAVVLETYSMTEIAPTAGMICRQGHLHMDISSGFTEVIHLTSGQPAAPGELGTLVVTPYYPYRECMPFFRYDTRDVVRRLPEEPLACEMAQLPAVSNIEGKAHFLLTFEDQVVTTRDLVEVIEALPSQPWPARFRPHVTARGIELEISERAVAGLSETEVLERFRQAGLPVSALHLVDEAHAESLRRLRGDLIQPIFSPPVQPMFRQEPVQPLLAGRNAR
jgi:phenylacetate-CoA ligase